MTETKEYASMLYRIADEIETEGRITEAAAELNDWTAERIREAAQRMDEQTVAINELRRQREYIAGVLKLAERELIAGKSNPLSLAGYLGRISKNFSGE